MPQAPMYLTKMGALHETPEREGFVTLSPGFSLEEKGQVAFLDVLGDWIRALEIEYDDVVTLSRDCPNSDSRYLDAQYSEEAIANEPLIDVKIRETTLGNALKACKYYLNSLEDPELRKAMRADNPVEFNAMAHALRLAAQEISDALELCQEVRRGK